MSRVRIEAQSRSTTWRALKLKLAQRSAASFARATTFSTSLFVKTGKTPTTSPVAGFVDSKVAGFFLRVELGLVAMG